MKQISVTLNPMGGDVWALACTVCGPIALITGIATAHTDQVGHVLDHGAVPVKR